MTSNWIHTNVEFALCPSIRNRRPPDVDTSSRVPKIFSGCFRVYFHHNDYSEVLVVFPSPSRPYQDKTSNKTRLQTIPLHILYKILGCYHQLYWPTVTEYLAVSQGYLVLWCEKEKCLPDGCQESWTWVKLTV